VDEPHAWVEDDQYDDDLLPGLDDNRGAGRGAAAPGGRAKPPSRRGRGRIALFIALAVVVAAVAVVGGVGYHYYTAYLHPADYSGAGSGSVEVQIKPGDPASVVGARLASLGVVASERAFANAAKASPQGNALQPGFYRVHKHMKASLALAMLLSPSSRVQTRVTIREGLRFSQIIQLLGKQTGNLKGYQQAAAHPASLGLPAYAHGNPEGYLFPATYDIQPNSSPTTVLKNMVARFGQEAQSLSLPSAAAHANLSQRDVITVASLIQAEGKRPQDLPKIARVIYNRLNSTPPMPLQLDTTVLYALHSSSPDVTIQQTKFKSPYNTYLHPGLPPGPINSPGDAAIRAALHPAQGNWLYFLTVNPNSGLTLFTNSYPQFQQFQAQLAANTHH
jgi:UPF0755 protein